MRLENRCQHFGVTFWSGPTRHTIKPSTHHARPHRFPNAHLGWRAGRAVAIARRSCYCRMAPSRAHSQARSRQPPHRPRSPLPCAAVFNDVSTQSAHSTTQVARLTRMEVEQRGCVGRLAAQHRAMEAAVQRFSPLPPTFSRPPPSTPSPIGAEPDRPPPAPAPVLDDCQSTHGSLPTCREPDNPEAAKLRAELDHLLRWLGDWSHGVATRISAQARSLEALSMDLACLAAVPSCAERQQRVSLLGNVLRDVQRVKGRADGALGVL